MSAPIAINTNQALTDFKELRELSALQFFDLYSFLREFSDTVASVLCVEVDSLSAIGTGGRIARYKLADPLLVCLAALRAK
jgi:hypothetical protein